MQQLSYKKNVVLIFLLLISLLSACKTTESTGLRDYSNGINEVVQASAENPAYTITETVGVAGSGYAYLIEKINGKWQMMYDSFDAKAFAKQVGNTREVPASSEVLWTDGVNVVVYFGEESFTFSRIDGSFPCPKNKKMPSHRACRSQLTETKSVFGGFDTENQSRPFVLDIAEIKKAVDDTRIVTIVKNRNSRESQ